MNFEELATSRKNWINDVLRPWCLSATRLELLKAENEWTDVAGKVDPTKTLWVWAWSRFPELTHETLGIDEASEVIVRLKSGTEQRGFPDSRQSLNGFLVLIPTDGSATHSQPISIDAIESVKRPS
jgi:hypothetical protein